MLKIHPKRASEAEFPTQSAGSNRKNLDKGVSIARSEDHSVVKSDPGVLQAEMGRSGVQKDPRSFTPQLSRLSYIMQSNSEVSQRILWTEHSTE